MGFSGSTFTWMRGVNATSFKGARLDRALGNAEWKLLYPNATVEHLPIMGSDHAPLLINTQPRQIQRSEKSFRFNAWPTHPNFYTFVDSVWDKSKDLESNKRIMAKALADWNTNTFGNIFRRKNRLLARLGGIQRSLSHKPRSDLIRLEKRLRLELDENLYQEELIWLQRPREEWIASGDWNTKFYHVAIATKNNINKIKELKDDNGQILDSEIAIREHVRKYFITLFSEDSNTNQELSLHNKFPTLSEADWTEINQPFSSEEIKIALFEMTPTKTPGPDGYTAGFYQKTWGTVCFDFF